MTRSLRSEFQPRWIQPRSKYTKRKDKKEVDAILKSFQDQLFVFLAPRDKNDKYVRDIISIKLVRLTQSGNISAQHQLKNLLKYTIHQWIEHADQLACWRGYDNEIQDQINGCIRRYRYSGSFMAYLYKTLIYAGRGLYGSYAILVEKHTIKTF